MWYVKVERTRRTDKNGLSDNRSDNRSLTEKGS